MPDVHNLELHPGIQEEAVGEAGFDEPKHA